MGKIADEQIRQQFEYINHLENALKSIKKEASAIDDHLIVTIVDSALSYGKEEID